MALPTFFNFNLTLGHTYHSGIKVHSFDVKKNALLFIQGGQEGGKKFPSLFNPGDGQIYFPHTGNSNLVTNETVAS